MTKLWERWEHYWFRPGPLVDLAIVRLIAVGFQLWHLAATRPLSAVANLQTLPDFMYAPLVIVRVMLLPFGWHYRPPEELMAGVYWATLAAGALALIGYRTTVSLLLFAAGNLFIQGYLYSFHEVHHPEAIVMITLLLLALAPAGRALSVDDLRRRLRAVDEGLRVPSDPLAGESRFARWPLLLVQWMFALIYLSAAFHKLSWSGLDWMNGWTLQYYMLQDALRWGSDSAGTGAGYAAAPGLGVWIGQHHGMMRIASWLSILFESTFWIVPLVPGLALVYLPIGVGFHATIYVLQRVSFFSFVWLYSVFVPWRDVLGKVGCWLAARIGRPVLSYDATSRRSVRRATVIRYFDLLGVCIVSARPPAVEGMAVARAR